MLLQFRKLTRGAIAAIIILLISVATVLFLVPNGGLNLAPSNALATVDGREITPNELSRELELTLRAERNNGNNLSQADAIEAGLHQRLLESMISRNAMYAYAEDIGVSASNAQLAEYLRSIPGVMNPITGSFDTASYQQFLSQLRYNQADFERELRDQLSTQMLLSSMAAGVRAPSSYGEIMFAYQTETRVVSIAEAPASAVGTIPAPTDAQIQALYEEVQDQIRLPEFRGITLVFARPEDFVARVNVPDERVEEEIEARRASLTEPERRSYVRLSAQSQQQATDAAARLNRGETPEAVAAALGLQITRGENQARNEVPDARIAEAVFTQPAGTARAVQGQLAPWAVVRVDAIVAAAAPDLSSLRQQVRQAIAADEAADLLNAAISTFEDARAGGASITEAARQAGMPTVSIPAVEAGGRDQTGAPVEAVAGLDSILQAAFETPEGEASDFIPAGEADVIVAVDRIIPATVRPLAEVRDDLVRLFNNREVARRLRESGAAMVAAVEGGQPFAAAARANGFAVRVSSQTINRQLASTQIPARGLPTQIFAATAGDVVTDLRADGGAVLVAQVESIDRPDPNAAPQIVEAIRGQVEQQLGESFGEGIEGEVVSNARIRRNERLLEQRFQSRANAADAP